jgi:acetyl esterase/lipase
MMGFTLGPHVFRIPRVSMFKNFVLVHATLWVALTAVTAWVWVISDRAFRRAEVPSSVVLSKDVAYRVIDGRRLSLDVYLPPGGAGPALPGPARPAILAIHGGSWIGGSKRLFRPSPRNTHPTAIRMAESGFVVIAADYRLARAGAPGWPAALDDLREAVRWARRHADELRIDPNRIAALGQSAGGHLAALLGTSADEGSRVQAIVNFYGPSDLERLPLERVRLLPHEPVHVFLGLAATDPSGKARDASPVQHVRGDTAPMLLIHGTRDLWVPIEQSEELAKTLDAAGVLHQLIRIEGARHGFEAEVNDPEVQDPRHRDLLPRIFAFLQSVWNAHSR